MKYNTKIILTKNRVRVIKSTESREVGIENNEREDYSKSLEGQKDDYSYKRALDNLVLTIDSNVSYYSKFITLTFKKSQLDYQKAMKAFKVFTKLFKRHFGFNLKYSRIAERQKKRGIKENNEGSWHFHLIVYINKKLDFNLLKSCWPYGSIDIKKVDNQKNLSRYFGKYFSKQKSDISLHKNLVSHSRGLAKPTIIYDNDITTFDNYPLLYHKQYDSPVDRTVYLMSEYDISKPIISK